MKGYRAWMAVLAIPVLVNAIFAATSGGWWNAGAALVSAGSAVFMTRTHRRIVSWRLPTVSDPRPVQPVRIYPTGPDDPFCTCPRCKTLGNHEVERAYEPGVRRIPSGPDGDFIELGYWGAPAPGPYTKRTCWMCGHVWRTNDVEQEKRS